MAEAEALDVEVLAGTTLERIVADLVSKHAPEPLVFDLDNPVVEQTSADSLKVSYRFTGSADRWTGGYEGNSAGYWWSYRATVATDHEVDASVLRRSMDGVESHVAEQVREINSRIEEERLALAEALERALEDRWRRTRMLRGALAELGIPVGPRTDAAVPIPVEPSPLNLSSVVSAEKADQPEWVLSEEVAETVVETIISFTHALERLPSTADRLVGEDEETLRDVLLVILNANYKGLATGETFVGQGKTDLLLRWQDRDAFVAECKIWRGEQKFVDGLDQLLDRYALWRHARLAMVVFIKDPTNATSLIEKAHTAVREHPKVREPIEESEPARRIDFSVRASGDERRPAHLTVIPVVIKPSH